MLIGGLCGLANGLLITRLNLPPFVATLGMFGIARGLAVWLAERTTLAFPIGGTAGVGRSGSPPRRPRSSIPGCGRSSLLAILTAVVLHFTVFGRHVYAVGSNEAAARLCGVNVSRTRLLVYTLAGLLTGWAGVILFAHSNSGNPTLGEQLELDVITAVVIGGASLSGGKGTVVGAMLGRGDPGADQERREPVQRAGRDAVHPDRRAAAGERGPQPLAAGALRPQPPRNSPSARQASRPA